MKKRSMRNVQKKTIWYGNKPPVEPTEAQRAAKKSYDFIQLLKNIS